MSEKHDQMGGTSDANLDGRHANSGAHISSKSANDSPNTHIDAHLELKKRARRRLVGAIALAVFAAIVLPMVMDQEPKSTTQDIQIRIPSQDASSFTSRIMPVTPTTSTPLPPVPVAVAEAKVEPKVEAKAEAKVEAKSEPKVEHKVEPKSEPKVEAKPVAKAEVKPDAKLATTPTTKVEATRPSAALSPMPKSVTSSTPEVAVPSVTPAEKNVAKTVDKPVDKKEKAKAEAALNGGEQWVVQLGAYRDLANVRALQSKLKGLGFASYTEVLAAADGSKKTRVRAGPFANKAAADKAHERIKHIGVDGIVAQK